MPSASHVCSGLESLHGVEAMPLATTSLRWSAAAPAHVPGCPRTTASWQAAKTASAHSTAAPRERRALNGGIMLAVVTDLGVTDTGSADGTKVPVATVTH